MLSSKLSKPTFQRVWGNPSSERIPNNKKKLSKPIKTIVDQTHEYMCCMLQPIRKL